MFKNRNGMTTGDGLFRVGTLTGLIAIVIIISSLLSVLAATQRSSPVFTNRKSSQFGMASELLENFNEDGDAWVTTGTNYFLIYQYNGNGYSTTNISRPQIQGTWGTYGFDVTCGDYNGDGYGDVIVSDPYWDDPQNTQNCGILVCYFSDDDPVSEQTDEISVEGVNTNGLGGYCIDTGNFNGDDYDDLIVGEPGYSSNYGQAHIFLGCSNPAAWGSFSSPDKSIPGSAYKKNWGVCVRSIEDDDDGDDYDDFCISNAKTSGSNPPISNQVAVYYGELDISNIDNTPSIWLEPQNMPSGTNSSYGMDVDTGDFNADGYMDIISMNKVYTTSGKSEFWIDIFLGSSSKYSTQNYFNYRTHVESWADVTPWQYEIATQGNDNGDAYDDVGYALYYYGPPPGNPTPIDQHFGIEGFYGESSLGWSSSDWIIPFPVGGDLSMGLFHGKSLNGVGEQNGDSKDDLIVGTYLKNQIDLYEGD